ncbi:MAG TPA: thioesterase family protein [Actinomycetota bacterium]|nr:thioesterase family protein [Actinomycetota bacterium]
MADAFYQPDGDRFVSTEWTRGPWGPDSQHAGPPSALLARAIERLDPDSGMRLSRFTAEILRPVPVTPVRVEARLVRPGRRVQYAEAVLSNDDGEIMRAAAWRIRTLDAGGSVPAVDGPPLPFALPEESPEPELPAFYEGPSYFTAMDWRFAGGRFFEPGPAAAWMRMRIPLVEGEAPSPAGRVLAAADSGNGISMVLPIDRFVFINVDLSVHLVRLPADEWVCLDAESRIDAAGVGLAESRLWDRHALLGRGNQSLLVAPR